MVSLSVQSLDEYTSSLNLHVYSNLAFRIHYIPASITKFTIKFY